MKKSTRKIVPHPEADKPDPLDALSAEDLDDIIADWTAAEPPPSGDLTLRTLRLVVERMAARMDLNRRQAA